MMVDDRCICDHPLSRHDDDGFCLVADCPCIDYEEQPE